MSPRLKFFVSRITLLFGVSFVLLWLHILDDAIITNEPAWYGITVFEFLLSCAVVYAIVPPLGVWLAIYTGWQARAVQRRATTDQVTAS